MYLKNLTILGFKSFADKTPLTFLPGITAVVGPNGCGKSNVADAIRWVLGEQSAKALRGGEMVDVIFNGTDRRKPLGMAEVSLTLGDVDREHLQAAGVELDFNEVTLTRRVFRDGVSEYFLNKTACRLKDIQQLFLGTGVGRSSYSIMAQGHITQILSSRPEDRRMIFEEAAGITKFKFQKKDALRKLEQTELNLVRITDLIREVKRQIISLQRQAGKAKRYKQLQQELQHLDTQLARHQFDCLQADLRQRAERAAQLSAELEAGACQLQTAETEITQLRAQLADLDRQISQTQQHGLELKGRMEHHEGRVQFNEERLREQEIQNAKALSDIAQGQERRAVVEQEAAALRERLDASRAKVEQLGQALAVKREAMQTVENQLRTQQDTLRRTQTDAFAAAQKTTRLHNDITALDLQTQGQSVRLEKLAAEKIQVDEEQQRLAKRLEEFRANVELEKQSALTRHGTVEEQQQRLRQIQQELGRLTQVLDEHLRQQAGKRSRLQVLQQLQSSHEGLGPGALAALKQGPQLFGALVDKIRVPDSYVTAVETALGHHLQLVLTDQPETARQILSDLREGRKGRASIAPLSWFALPDPAPAAAPAVALADGAPIPALSVIEAEPVLRPLLERLLSHTFLVPDLAQAMTCWQAANGQAEYVTLTGEMLSRHGIFSGGSANVTGPSPSSMLGRKNQIAELQAQLEQLQEQVKDLSRQKGALGSEQTERQAALQQVQAELQSQEVAIATRQGECQAIENALRLLHQKIATVAYETQTLAAREAEGRRQREILAGQSAEAETIGAALQAQVSDLTAALEGLRQQRDAAQNSLAETKIALAGDEQIAASLHQQRQAHEQRLRELAALVEQRQAEIAGFLARRQQLEGEIAESRAQFEALQHEREQVNAQTAERLRQRSDFDQDLSCREGSLRAQRQQLADSQQQRHALEVELAEMKLTAQNHRERLQQKYQVNLDDVRSECITITIADQGPAKVETLTPDEMAARGLATDWPAVADQVALLQQRLLEMGEVNLVAIAEYEETEQRYQFLAEQEVDLVKAKEQLLEAISRMNAQTREMFLATFNQVRDNFRVLFSEVFNGGAADLELVEDGDVLECGIEIMARPPGKQLKNISLLSGGEQTMTAVALMFAIYQVKPSPFCVLDELDAPLDESNINRFIAVLKRFLVHSQFLLITHNKRTIAISDVIYGVTMQEHGVSKIVSMKFNLNNADDSGPLPVGSDNPQAAAALKAVAAAAPAVAPPAPELAAHA